MKLKEHGPEKAVLISIFLLRKLHKKKKSIVSFNLEILLSLFFFLDLGLLWHPDNHAWLLPF